MKPEFGKLFRRQKETPEVVPPEEAKRRVKERVEQALQNPIQRGDKTRLNNFGGKFSTNLDKVSPDVTSEYLRGLCVYTTVELADAYPKGELEISANQSALDHCFGVDRSQKPEIIVDPTIGSIVPEHPNIFVGTKDELKQIVPKDAFDNLYGDNPRPANPQHTEYARKVNDSGERRIWDPDYKRRYINGEDLPE